VDDALPLEDLFDEPAVGRHRTTTPDAGDSMAELAQSDLAHLLGPNGPLAAHLDGYELRPSQLEMAQAVKRAFLGHEHAVVEAPTGTGKSIAYLLPAILAGRTVVVSTANKSLQSQLFQKEIPFLRALLGKPIPTVVVKGRSNYVCNLKWEREVAEQRYISLYDREDEQVAHMRRWLDETATGDVDELPFVLGSDLRPRVVSFPDDCLHADCPYAEDNCWVNRMRDEAAQAQILITNHHLLLNALELGHAGERILPPASIYVVDEAHHLEQIATSVYETVVTDYTVEQLLQRTAIKENAEEEELDELRYLSARAFQEASNLSRENAYRIEGELESMKALGSRLARLAQRMKQANPFAAAVEQAAQTGQRLEGETAERNRYYELALEALGSAATKLQAVAVSKRDDQVVRYAVRVFDRRHITLEVHAAPINPADLLARYVFHPEEEGRPLDRTVVCTSATLATNGNFEHFKARCGIRTTGEEHVLPAVFDYPRQALLYQPALPAYDYRNASAYYDAAAQEIERLLEVSRGRALCLFTNWSGLQQVSDRLQNGLTPVIWPLRAQGDAPRELLLTWFKQTPHSVLLATRSFWEGVDIPGDDLSLVILDKMPFPTPGDPLHGARMQRLEQEGHSSFGEYMVPLMTLALKQGFGRLIRRTSDRGVVAILDERLTSKGYGRQVRRDLPAARFSREFRDVYRFFQAPEAGTGFAAEFALNVWGDVVDAGGTARKPAEDGAGPRTLRWRWQLTRLHDGRADGEDGLEPLADQIAGEVFAATQGLANLRRRVERAGHRPAQYAVEVRCTAAAARLLNTDDASDHLQRWLTERAHWKRIQVLPLPER
jgi:ATP-dependent DNA helicase DinG